MYDDDLRCRLSNREVGSMCMQSVDSAAAAAAAAAALRVAASCLSCSSSCAGWPDLLLLHWIWPQWCLSQTRFIFYGTPWQYCVACTPSTNMYILGNYGYARSQGGRQPAAANPRCIILICKTSLYFGIGHVLKLSWSWLLCFDRFW